MINKADFKKIRSNLDNYDKKREELIKKSRDVLKLSKQLLRQIHEKAIVRKNGIHVPSYRASLSRLATTGDDSLAVGQRQYV